MLSINYHLHAVRALVFRKYKMYKRNVLQNNQNVSETHINKSTQVRPMEQTDLNRNVNKYPKPPTPLQTHPVIYHPAFSAWQRKGYTFCF